jgi:DNA-directed RNA polymerase subunit M/transcription elongation factor TFIIS
MNPIWTQMIYRAVRNVTKVCTHCKRAAVYAQKPVGKFYKCTHCGHRFKEKGKRA